MDAIIAQLDSLPINKRYFFRRWLQNSLVAMLFLQFVYSLSISHAYNDKVIHQIGAIAERIALDLPLIVDRLPLSTEFENPNSYTARLNDYLESQNFAVSVTQIRVQTSENKDIADSHVFFSNDKNIAFDYQKPPMSWWQYLSVWPVLFGMLFSAFAVFHYYKNKPKEVQLLPEERSPQLLTLDLRNKQLINFQTEKSVPLANKPLCFYAALVEYCVSNPGETLNQNKDLPVEMEMLCKKYFARLIELGHTIRKRPDFTTNIEKTLSEIRACLDELYEDDLASKDPLYPRKAVGEGSRSKAHSYALKDVSAEHIHWLGN